MEEVQDVSYSKKHSDTKHTYCIEDRTSTQELYLSGPTIFMQVLGLYLSIYIFCCFILPLNYSYFADLSQSSAFLNWFNLLAIG